MPSARLIKPGRLPFILAGGLAVLACPPVDLWFLAWFALIPLIVHARSLHFWLAFRRGWWGGLLFNTAGLYWIALNSGAPGIVAFASLVGVLLVFPLYWGFFAAIWSALYRRWGDRAALLLPGLWVALEVIKNAPEIGFPWLEMGLTQVTLLPFVQMAEWGGIRLVSFAVVALNVGLYLLWRRRTTPAVLMLAGIAAAVIWGAWRLGHLPVSEGNLRVLIVQGNVDPRAKWEMPADSSLVIYEEMTTRFAAGDSIELVLWPETAVPAYLGYQARYQRRMFNLAGQVGAPILTGAPHYELDEDDADGHLRFNSAFLFPAAGRKIQRYDKIRLVPFGERVPFQEWFPVLGELNFGQAEFTPGREYTVFDLSAGVTVSAQICFESVFGQESRQFVQHGARVLCNLTNDGWYGDSSGPYQHAALVQFQAIETRCPVVRAANTGISLAIDRSGRVNQHLPYGVPGALIVNVQPGIDRPTFYVQYGELIPWLISFGTLVFLLVAIFNRPKKG